MNTYAHKQVLLATTFLATVVIFSAAVASATAAEWGTLKGQFIYEGKPGEPAPITVTKDQEFCGKHDLVGETLVVGDDGGLANVFVYLYLKRGATVDVHPDLESPGDEPVVLDNKGCRFEPHAMIVRTSEPFEIRNSDPVSHNTNMNALLKNPGFNQIIPNDAPLKMTFESAESYPSPVACNIHPWMNAHVLIRDNPYMAVSKADGSFEIENIPAGEHEFIFWHEAKGNMRDLKVGEEETSRRGRAELEIPAGGTLDLGEIKVKPAVLGK